MSEEQEDIDEIIAENYVRLLNTMRSNQRFIYTRINLETRDVDRWRNNDVIDAMASALIELPKQKILLMDSKYPHVCFECKNPLEYKHVFEQYMLKFEFSFNYTERIDCKDYIEWKIKRSKEKYQFKKQFKKIWRSKYVKFLCCNCYSMANNVSIQRSRRIQNILYNIHHEES